MRERVEHHKATKDAHKAGEEQRIENLRQLNNEKRWANKEAIARNRNSVVQAAMNDREKLKGFLQSNYSSFYNEKMAEQNEKMRRANEAYNQKHQVIARNNNNRKGNYQMTSIQHQHMAHQNVQAKQEREKSIERLEAMEQQMVSNLQNTLQRKNDAVKELKSKSRSLKKVFEPRNAYKYVVKSNEGSDPAMRTMSNFGSPSQQSIQGTYKQRSGSVVPPQRASPASGQALSPNSPKFVKKSNEV